MVLVKINHQLIRIFLFYEEWKDEALQPFKINQDLASMIPFLNSIKKVDLLSAKILESERINLKFLDRDLMIIKMLFLNMVVNNNLNMDLVLEFRWKVKAIFLDLENMNLKNKFIQKLVELWQEIWVALWSYLKPQGQDLMMNQVIVMLKVEIPHGHYQNHHDRTCTKITVLVLVNIKQTRLTKVLSQKHPVISSVAIRGILHRKLNLQDQGHMIKALWNQECQ